MAKWIENSTHAVSLRCLWSDSGSKDIDIWRANKMYDGCAFQCCRMFSAIMLKKTSKSTIRFVLNLPFEIYGSAFFPVYLYFFFAQFKRIIPESRTNECDKSKREWTKCVEFGADDELWFLSLMISRIASILWLSNCNAHVLQMKYGFLSIFSISFHRKW